MRDRGDDAGAEGKLGEALEIARAAGHSVLVEQIERRLSEDVGDPAGFQAALDQLHRARERLAEIFREGRERDRKLYDERETGLEGPSGLGGTPFDDR